MKKLKTLCANIYNKVSPRLDTVLEDLYFWFFNKIDWKQWTRAKCWFYLFRKLTVLREIKKHIDRRNYAHIGRYILFFFGLHRVINSVIIVWWMRANYVARMFGL